MALLASARTGSLESIEPKRRISIAPRAIGAREDLESSWWFPAIFHRAVDDRRFAL
jgi:hypothetical protein